MVAATPVVVPIAVGNNIAPNGLNEDGVISQSLAWIGFNTVNQRDRLIDECMGLFQDIRLLDSSDVDAMVKDYANRTPANGKMIFGMNRTKRLKAFIHWVQDFGRISATPEVTGLNQATFRAALNTASVRAEIRVNLRKQTSTAAEAASPGPLESERKWKQWEEKFINYTRAHMGVGGVPLSYVIRENEDPDTDGTFDDFISKSIACAPLSGEYYLADRLTVFNMIVSFTTGCPSGDWVKDTLRYSDGRRSMAALRSHFGGAGNASRNKAEADRLYDSLHYKSERSMAFETFLTQCKNMFNIYEKEGEPMTDGQKVRFLFKKIQHSGLVSSIDSLKALQTKGIEVTFDKALSHISTSVSELPEYIARNRNVSAVSAKSENKGIYDDNGKIITGHIPHWHSLSEEEKSLVKAESKKLRGMKGKGQKGKSAATANQVKQLKSQNAKYKRKIKAMKRNKEVDDDNEDADANESEAENDAGDQFGGKSAKKKQKKKRD